MEEIIYGRNAVTEALRSGHRIQRLLVMDNAEPKGIAEILALGKEQGLTAERVKSEVLNKLCEKGRHQGVVAVARPLVYASMETVFSRAKDRGEEPFILLLDELQDPQNVGALIRTADAAGVHGVLLPKRHACPLSGTVAKVSAGAVEYVPVVQIGNISRTIGELQKKGCWVVGADMDGIPYTKADLTGPLVLVIGAEGKGLGRLVKEHCDVVVSLPMAGGVNSLNASAAGAVLMYEVVRQRYG